MAGAPAQRTLGGRVRLNLVGMPVVGSGQGRTIAPMPTAETFRPRPPEGDTWIAFSAEALPVEEATRWAGRPDCGAVVVFTGNARDHSPGRADVTELAYEAYEEQAVPRMARIVDEARRRWTDLRCVALLHRTGVVGIGEPAVVVVTSSPHREGAYASNRFCIDALKATVPIWKREAWDGGEHWGTDAQHVVDLDGLEGQSKEAAGGAS